MKKGLKSFARALLFAAAAVALLSLVESRGMTQREAGAKAAAAMQLSQLEEGTPDTPRAELSLARSTTNGAPVRP